MSACQQNNNLQTSSSINWTNLDVGNYWIYDRIDVDMFGDTSISIAEDSVYVSQDTVINGNTYHTVVGWWLVSNIPYHLRDSLQYLVDHTGKIWFSSIQGFGPFNVHSPSDCSGGGAMIWQNEMGWYFSEIWDGSYHTVISNNLGISCNPSNSYNSDVVLPTKYALGIGKVEEYLMFSSWFHSNSPARFGRRLNHFYVQ